MCDSVDSVQYHILGVIHSLMDSYGLSNSDLSWYVSYINSIPKERITHNYKEYSAYYPTTHETEKTETFSDDDKKDDSGEPLKYPIYVTTRREFCNTMHKGIKICPKYSTCTNAECKHFHIESKYICPHVTRGSYCDHNECELIVIRACRKGKRCNDADCSFRHQ